MTIKELASVTQTPIKVLSGRDGKILCHRFISEKHQKLGSRNVLDVWAEISAKNSAFSSFAQPVICVFADMAGD